MLFLAVAVEFQVALLDGSTVSEGRLEVYYNGMWGTVCADGFTVAEAQAVCRSLAMG